MSNCLDYSEDHSSAHHPPKSSPQVGSTQSEPDYQIEITTWGKLHKNWYFIWAVIKKWLFSNFLEKNTYLPKSIFLRSKTFLSYKTLLRLSQTFSDTLYCIILPFVKYVVIRCGVIHVRKWIALISISSEFRHQPFLQFRKYFFSRIFHESLNNFVRFSRLHFRRWIEVTSENDRICGRLFDVTFHQLFHLFDAVPGVVGHFGARIRNCVGHKNVDCCIGHWFNTYPTHTLAYCQKRTKKK